MKYLEPEPEPEPEPFLSVPGGHAIDTKSNQIAKICFIFCDNMT